MEGCAGDTGCCALVCAEEPGDGAVDDDVCCGAALGAGAAGGVVGAGHVGLMVDLSRNREAGKKRTGRFTEAQKTRERQCERKREKRCNTKSAAS